MGLSPTQLSLRHLERAGYTAAITERWNPWARVRQDLFGFGDLIAFQAGQPVLIVQTTSTSNQSKRVAKIRANQTAALWVQAGGRIEVHGWRKSKAGRWQVTVTEVTPT